MITTSDMNHSYSSQSTNHTNTNNKHPIIMNNHNTSKSKQIKPQPPHTPSELTFAKRTLQKLVLDSQFFPLSDSNNSVKTINEVDLLNNGTDWEESNSGGGSGKGRNYVGEIIGKGGFCEVRLVKLSASSISHSRRGSSSRHPQNHPKQQKRYAMKYLSPSKTTSTKVFQRGIADLAMEACFLSLLRHDNIINLHFVSGGSLEENYNCIEQEDGGQYGRGGVNRGGHHSLSSIQQSRTREEIITDQFGNLQIRQVPLIPPQSIQPPAPQPRRQNHLFGYFLLLDELSETLTDRIDYTYIPQVLSNEYGYGEGNYQQNHMIEELNTKVGLGIHIDDSMHGGISRGGSNNNNSDIVTKDGNKNWRTYFESSSSKVSSSKGGDLSSSHPTTSKVWDKIRAHSPNPRRHSSSNSKSSNNNKHNNLSCTFNSSLSSIEQQQTSYNGGGVARKSSQIQQQQCYNPRQQLLQRLQILKDVASALTYLHTECKLLFRDVKPDNIGFYRDYFPQCTCGYRRRGTSSRGEEEECTCYKEITKLFDFGLCKELKPKYIRKSMNPHQLDFNEEETTYKLTSCTGSRRYMAPEVCFGQPYNEKADVYSFGILAYQVLSLVVPFDNYSMGKHEREVLRGGYRPDVTLPPSASSIEDKSNGSSSIFNKGSKKKSRKEEEERHQRQVEEEQQLILESLAAEGDFNEEARENALLGIRTKRYWPKEVPRLMEQCWEGDMRRRPTMKEVERCLDQIIYKMVHQR